MTAKKLKRKYGVVVLLDALGASEYSDEKIKEFLSARAEINSIINNLAKELTVEAKFPSPNIFTFGDTIIITIKLRNNKYISSDIMGVILLMRRYLFHFLDKGILFRGSFSIDFYIEDSDSNTVMGPAVTDAASWYQKSEWMGLSCTPKTNSVLEYHFSDQKGYIDNIEYTHKYDVPLKDGKKFNLYTISWPAVFHDKDILKESKKDNPRKWFLETLKDLPVPNGAEIKYENTKEYFTFVEREIANKSLQPTAKSGG